MRASIVHRRFLAGVSDGGRHRSHVWASMSVFLVLLLLGAERGEVVVWSISGFKVSLGFTWKAWKGGKFIFLWEGKYHVP